MFILHRIPKREIKVPELFSEVLGVIRVGRIEFLLTCRTEDPIPFSTFWPEFLEVVDVDKEVAASPPHGLR